MKTLFRAWLIYIQSQVLSISSWISFQRWSHLLLMCWAFFFVATSWSSSGKSISCQTVYAYIYMCLCVHVRTYIYASIPFFAGAALSSGAGAVFSWTFRHEIANHSLQLYRLDTMAAQVKFLDWWQSKTQEWRT